MQKTILIRIFLIWDFYQFCLQSKRFNIKYQELSATTKQVFDPVEKKECLILINYRLPCLLLRVISLVSDAAKCMTGVIQQRLAWALSGTYPILSPSNGNVMEELHIAVRFSSNPWFYSMNFNICQPFAYDQNLSIWNELVTN